MNGNTIDGRYKIERRLGSGGMAEVFLAHDGVLDRDVALKVLRSQLAGYEEFGERFRREARSAASLSHPNIVQVYDRGEAPDGTNYIAMEYVSGGTLKEWLDERGPLEPPRALAVADQIAGALRAAHERGVIHRDIKPQNVLVTALGHLKVADFGIARAGSSATISVANAVFGTAAYLSPEQALGEPATPKSDLYSLGVVLYELLTGTVPYTADNPIVVCMKHVTEPLRPPSRLDPTIPPIVNALVVKLLAKDPADRPADAAQLLDDLDRVRAGTAPKTPARDAATAGVPTGTPTGTPAAAPAKATTRATAGSTVPSARTGGGAPVRRGRRGMVTACAVVVAILAGVSALAFAPGDDPNPLARVQNVATGVLDTPVPPDPEPPDAPPGSPPGSPPPGSPSPGDSQYDGAG